MPHFLTRAKAPSGFSLIETMIVLFLTAAMLYMVAKLTNQTLSTLKFLQEKSASTESATLSCQRLASELREAVSVPNISTSGVSFQKIIPSSAPVVGNVATEPDPVNWDMTYPASSKATITYSQTGDQVMRQVSGEGALEVATRVNTFTVSRYSSGREGAYRIALTILESRRAVTFETIAVCPGVIQ